MIKDFVFSFSRFGFWFYKLFGVVGDQNGACEAAAVAPDLCPAIAKH